MPKSPKKGSHSFGKLRFRQFPKRHALVEARYAYLYSRYEDARTFIRPFFAAYKTLKILDDNFLYTRGLPFFGSYWNHLAAFSVLSGDWAELDEVTAYVSKNCSDYDFDRLRIERDAYCYGDATQLLSVLRKRIEEIKTVPAFPTGFTRMMIAVIEAGQAPTVAGAQGIIGNVTLARNDFPWLQDVQTLVVADAAHRLGDSDVERKGMATFLKRQPLLFEPDIALEFCCRGPRAIEGRLAPVLKWAVNKKSGPLTLQ